MVFLTAQYSLRGGRAQNEDAVFAYAENDFCFAAVADGLGMHGGGDVASQTALEVLAHCFMEDRAQEKEAIENCLEKANSAILEKQTVSCRMKSTVALTLALNGKLAFAHVGDSRIYHFRDGRISYQSKDHSVSQAAVFAGEIDASKIRFHQDRNRVLRALGVEGRVCPDITFPSEPISAGDAFLLCTDGFWEYVWEPEMVIDLAKSETPEQWVSYLFGRIGKRIDGDNDNLSVAAVFCMDSEDK